MGRRFGTRTPLEHPESLGVGSATSTGRPFARQLRNVRSRPALGMGGSVLLAQALTAAIGLVGARDLGPAGKGQVTAALSWAQILVFVFLFGLSFAISVRVAESHGRELDSVLGNAVFYSVTVSLLVGGASSLLLPRLLDGLGSGTSALVRWALLGGGITMVADLLASIHVALGHNLRYSVYRLALPLVSAAVVLPVWLAGWLTPGWVVAGFLAGALMSVVVVAPSLPWRSMQINLRMLKSDIAFGFKTYLASLLGLVNLRLDILVMSIFLSSTTVGLYGLANNAMVPLTAFPAAGGLLLLRSVAKDGDSRVTTSRVLRLGDSPHGPEVPSNCGLLGLGHLPECPDSDSGFPRSEIRALSAANSDPCAGLRGSSILIARDNGPGRSPSAMGRQRRRGCGTRRDSYSPRSVTPAIRCHRRCYRFDCRLRDRCGCWPFRPRAGRLEHRRYSSYTNRPITIAKRHTRTITVTRQLTSSVRFLARHLLPDPLVCALRARNAGIGALIGGIPGLTSVQTSHLLRRMQAASDNLVCGHGEEELLRVAIAIAGTPPDVPGVVVECGCWKGGSSAKLSVAAGLTGRQFFVFDSFQGLPSNAQGPSRTIHGQAVSFPEGEYVGTIEEVRDNVRKYGDISVTTLVPGWFEDTLPSFSMPLAVAYLDVDLVTSTQTCIKYLWPCLSPGGVIFSQDGHITAVLEALEDELSWDANLNMKPPRLYGAGQQKLIYMTKQ